MANQIKWHPGRNLVELQSKGVGDCFSINEKLYMITNSGPAKADGLMCCLDLGNGNIEWINWKTCVVEVDIAINAFYR